MITEQQRAQFEGWFDEMRLSFFKAGNTKDKIEHWIHLRRFRRAFRVLDQIIKEVTK